MILTRKFQKNNIHVTDDDNNDRYSQGESDGDHDTPCVSDPFNTTTNPTMTLNNNIVVDRSKVFFYILHNSLTIQSMNILQIRDLNRMVFE